MARSGTERAERVLAARCYAKINLGLRVLGRRPDGFHEIDTVLQTVSLADRLLFRVLEGGRLRVLCDAPGVPAGPQNLVHRALESLRRAAGGPELGMEVRLRKGIPVGAGLGGGSSDAACALAVANELWGLGWDAARLERLAAGLGSDVPFFLRGGTQRARGRGEVLEPLPPVPQTTFGLVIPPVRMDTATVYAQHESFLTGSKRNASMVPQLLAAADATELADLLENDLEATALAVAPELGKYRERLLALGIPVVRMTGTGSAFYFWPAGEAMLQRVTEALADLPAQVTLVETTGSGWEREEMR
jgi:4-diphosphocytidyl-2-C-methyl-D-erythritol kinase